LGHFQDKWIFNKAFRAFFFSPSIPFKEVSHFIKDFITPKKNGCGQSLYIGFSQILGHFQDQWIFNKAFRAFLFSPSIPFREEVSHFIKDFITPKKNGCSWEILLYIVKYFMVSTQTFVDGLVM
jgi:hypothetical protein